MKNQIKRIGLSILLSAAICSTFALMACNNNNHENDNPNNNINTPQTPSTDSLIYTELSDGTYSVAASGKSVSGNITIPSTYNGKTVTAIKANAFYSCSSITGITIPNTVTSIGLGAFRGCSSLYDITIPDSVTKIGSSAFSDMYLQTITIGKGLQTIGESAFGNTYSLKGVYISDIAAWCNVKFEGQYSYQANPLCRAKNLYLNGQLVTELKIPENVTTIGETTFRECASIEKLIIHDNVTAIGEYAFLGCSGLTSVTIGNSVKSIGDYAFKGCNALTSVAIPNGVTSIRNNAFEDCSGLTSVTIGNSVTTIGYNAFCGCSSLENILFSGTREQWDTVKLGKNAIPDTASITYLNN